MVICSCFCIPRSPQGSPCFSKKGHPKQHVRLDVRCNVPRAWCGHCSDTSGPGHSLVSSKSSKSLRNLAVASLEDTPAADGDNRWLMPLAGSSRRNRVQTDDVASRAVHLSLACEAFNVCGCRVATSTVLDARREAQGHTNAAHCLQSRRRPIIFHPACKKHPSQRSRGSSCRRSQGISGRLSQSSRVSLLGVGFFFFPVCVPSETPPL